MRCLSCRTENPDTQNYCGNCGTKLPKACPDCGSGNPTEYAFCGECGHNLDPPAQPPSEYLSFDEKLKKIKRYLPTGLTEKILLQKDKIEGERKQVTVMFCDLERFTEISEMLGPEDAYSTMDEIYEILICKVHDYEGTVNEMTGDGVMALFGAPIALEDAPQRAIRSALAIHKAMSMFNDRFNQGKEDKLFLRMRAGIHTGSVVVGTLGNDLRVKFKAVGDTVNLASRMEGLAEPGTTYVTEKTFKLTEGLFRFEAVGERRVRGKKEPVSVYRVIAPSSRKTRFDVSAERGLTPHVGRERELEILLDGLERVKAGRGQVFSIIAEAGLGKSRLLYEFRKTVANEDAFFLEGKCLSYSRGVAYHPLIDILKSNFDVQAGDGDDEVRIKVRKGLTILEMDEAFALPYFLELLSVRDSGIDEIPMSPESRKDHIIKALVRLLLKGSELRPLIIAVEDLHWIDKSSEHASKYLLESIAGARVLLILTYRPEFVPTWGSRSYHSQLTLNRLSNRESLVMATHLLGTEISTALEDLILEKTEGVPFFIEEFIKSLKDLKVIESKDGAFILAKHIEDVIIPSTIQDVIMARVDSLPGDAKEVLQTGSVVEREFSYELTKRVTGLPEKKLLSHLSVLKDSELIYERGIYPKNTYIFKHALTQKVVYDSILTKRKKRLHEKTGNVIEALYKDSIDERYGVLAEHFIRSENYGKGAKYSAMGVKKFEKTASLNDAIAYAKKRVLCLEKLPPSGDVQKKIIDARSTLGLYFYQMGYFVEAKDAVDSIFNSALKLNYTRRLSQIYAIMGSYEYWVVEDFSGACKHLEESIRISEEVNDFVSLVLANWALGVASAYHCEFEKAIHYIRKALELNVEAKSLWGISLMKSSLSLYAYNYQGTIGTGFKISDEALRIAEESGDTYSMATAYTGHGCSWLLKGELDKAEEDLLKGVHFGERIDFLFSIVTAHAGLGETYYEIGEYRKSKNHYKKAISFLENAGISPSWINLIKLGLTRTRIMNHEKEVDLRSLRKTEADNKVKLHDGLMARYIGEIFLNIDDQHTSDAENWIRKAVEADKGNGAVWQLGRDFALYAELLKRKGDNVRAKENMNKAIGIFNECGADGWSTRYCELV